MLSTSDLSEEGVNLRLCTKCDRIYKTVEEVYRYCPSCGSELRLPDPPESLDDVLKKEITLPCVVSHRDADEKVYTVTTKDSSS